MPSGHNALIELFSDYNIPADLRQHDAIVRLGLALVEARGMVERLKGVIPEVEKAVERIDHPATFFLDQACLYRRRTGCFGLNGLNGECINCTTLRWLKEAVQALKSIS